MNTDNLKPGCVYKSYSKNLIVFLHMSKINLEDEGLYYFYSLERKNIFARGTIFVKRWVEEL